MSPQGQGESSTRELRSLINALAGKWTLNVRFEPMGGMPTAFTGVGEERWHEGPGGYTLIEEEHIPTPGGEGYLLGIFWWDKRTKSLQGMECNNQLPFTCDLKGALADITISWDEKTLAVNEVETQDGKKSTWHEVWSQITPTSFLQTGDVTQADGSTSRLMTITGTRVKTQE